MTKRLFHLCVSSTAAAVLFAPTLGIVDFPAGSVAQAQAQTCEETYRTVRSGALEWGVKESFRDYVVGPIAQGDISFSNGVESTGNGFIFPAVESAGGSGSKGSVNFGGEIRFYAHEGKMDITLSNLKLRINGSYAELSADYESLEFTGVSATDKGALQTGQDVTFATVRLDNPANFDADSLNLSGTVTLNDNGVPVFGGFYEDEDARQFDDLAVQVQLGDACGTVPEDDGVSNSGQGAGATDSGATEGVPGLLGTINDSLIEVNGLVVNSTNLITNADKLADAAQGNSGTQSAQGSTGLQRVEGTQSTSATQSTQSVQSATTSGGSGATSVSLNAQAESPSTGTVTSARTGAARTGSEDTCVAVASRGVESAQALWGVRTSFRNYLQSSIAEGGWRVQDVGYDGGQFQFAGNSGAVSAEERSGTINFGGAIQFYGHGGVLDTRMSDLQIQFSGNSGQLIANVRANDTDGNARDMGRVTLANLSMSSLDINDSSVSGSASVTLTAEGSAAFGDFYPAGDPLDGISFSANLGGEPECGAPISLTAATVASAGSAGSSGSNGSNRTTATGTNGFGSDLDGFDQNFGSQSGQDDKFSINSAAADNKESFFDLNAALTALIVLGAFVLGRGTRTKLSKKAGE